MRDAHVVVERTFREESSRVMASLISALDDFDLAEDAFQEAIAVALERWPADGVPQNPGAWITTTARRKASDRLRREKVRLRKQETLEALGLMEAAGMEEALADYHLFHAARADLLRREGQWHAAEAAYRRALDLAENAAERAFLQRRLDEVGTAQQ